MGDKSKPVLSVRVDAELIERIDKLVEKTGVSRADVIERALAVGLNDQEWFVADLQGAVRGPLLELLMSEKFLNVVFSLTGEVTDANQMNAIRNVRAKARARKSGGRPAAM